MRYFIYTVIAVVLAAIVTGFFIAGSPATERLRRFDSQRLSDLQTLQWEIINFWQNKGRLPNELAELNDDLRGFRVPADPVPGTAEKAREYGYHVKGALSFALCADFALPSSEGVELLKPAASRPAPLYYGEVNQNWQHPAGQHCFDRSIDPDLYKSAEKR